jgi:hypothetical protein
MKKILILILSGSLTSFAFASQIPVNASTDLIVDNNTAGIVNVDLGKVQYINVKGNDLNPSLPATISGPIYKAFAVQDVSGEDYAFTIPFKSTNYADGCLLKVYYNSYTDKVNVSTTSSSSKFKCVAITTTEGFNNSITLDIVTR